MKIARLYHHCIFAYYMGFNADQANFGRGEYSYSFL